MSVHDAIIAEMRRIAVEQKKTLGPLDDDASLMTCGLDSLGFAVLVARLEEQLGTDPFSEARRDRVAGDDRRPRALLRAGVDA